MAEGRSDLTLAVLAVSSLVGLVGASIWVLRPLLGALTWATMIVVATWPLLLRVEKAVGNRRWLAVTIMSLMPLVLVIVPLWWAIATFLSNVGTIAGWAKTLSEYEVPAPPAWIGSLPVVGGNASALWHEVATDGMEVLTAKLAPYLGILNRRLAAEVGNFGVVFVQFLLIVLFAAILYAQGEHAGSWARRFGARLAGARGERLVALSGQAIRGVALGVVVTALAQALVGGVGLLIAGVPFAAILTALMFMLAVAQMGPLPVLIPAVVWLYWSGSAGWGTVLLFISLIAGTIDNVIRIFLIKQEGLPVLLVFAGVIGGLIGFGLVGIFVGPLVLAVTYTLLRAWIEDAESGRPALPAESGDPGGETAR